MKHVGRCHCGAIGFELSTEIPIANWAVRACQCTFCRAHAALSTSDPQGSLQFVFDDNAIVAYRFGLRTADFLLCNRCGVYVGARTEIDGRSYGIINVRALVEPMPEVASQPMNYEGEALDGRNTRRASRWTPLR